MIDSRLFQVIKDIARVQGGLTGVSQASKLLYPSTSALMECYATDLKAIGDMLMAVVGVDPNKGSA